MSTAAATEAERPLISQTETADGEKECAALCIVTGGAGRRPRTRASYSASIAEI